MLACLLVFAAVALAHRGWQGRQRVVHRHNEERLRRDATQDDGKTFRGYSAGSMRTIQLTGPHDLTEIRTFAGHADDRASQGYTVLVAHAAAPKEFVRLATATLRCDGGASELRVKSEAKSVLAVRCEFQNGPAWLQCLSRSQSRGTANQTEK